jgi:peptide deformylase
MAAKTKLQIITLGDPLLHHTSLAVTDLDGDLENLIKEMFRSMYNGQGVGLAAVQVGRLLRVFITHLPKDEPRVFINPEILTTSIDENVYEEGCLSVPAVYADVKRPVAVRVQAVDLKGKPFTIQADEFLARVVQHELDHLNGVLFIEKVPKDKKKQLLKTYQRKIKI